MDLFDILERDRIVGGFVIERGIPVSSDRQESQRPKWEAPKFPFAALRIGESFTVSPPDGFSLLETQNTVSGAACSYRKKQEPGSCNFTTRQIGGRFVRCWRTV